MSSCFLHHSNLSTSGETSSEMAKYAGSSLIRPFILTSLFKNGKSLRVSTSGPVGFMSLILDGSNRCAHLNNESGIAISSLKFFSK